MSSHESASPRARSTWLLAGAGALAVALVVIVAVTLKSLTGAVAPRDAEAAAPALSLQQRGAILDSARVYLREDEPGKAEAILREAIEQSPRDQDFRTLYAETLLRVGRPHDAYQHYEHAIAVGPDHAELRHAAGTVANTVGLPQVALVHYHKAQTLNPASPKHPLYLAQIQRKLGQTDEAKASLLRAAKLDPSLAQAWGSLAAIALDENKLSVARGFVERAREAEPSSHGWRLLQAKILRRGNDPEAALRLLSPLDRETLLADPGLLEEQAMCLGMLGRPAEAAALYADAVERLDRLPPDDRPDRYADLLRETARWYERAGEDDVAALYARRADALRTS
jgi:Tfp pilus assembly protein PilF